MPLFAPWGFCPHAQDLWRVTLFSFLENAACYTCMPR
jgi:hypothetical protein